MLHGGRVVLVSHDFHHEFRGNLSALLKIGICMATAVWNMILDLELSHQCIKIPRAPIVETIMTAFLSSDKGTAAATIYQIGKNREK